MLARHHGAPDALKRPGLMNNSSTDIFYALLEQDEQEKSAFLHSLKSTEPLLYQQVSHLLAADQDERQSLTALFGGSASALFTDICFSGLLLDKYQLLEKIGQGGMGVVYAAKRRDETYQQELAIKFIQPGLTEILGKHLLYQEAQLLALLNHPYIAKVFDAGEHQSYVYMVMEKIIGLTLKQYLQSAALQLRQVLQLFAKICEAIEHAHQNQILHADIKPDNVLVDARGNPKVFDFNMTQKQQQFSGTKVQLKAYSQCFASPEQQRGEHLTQQSDVFSLGELLKVMIASFPHRKELALISQKATAQQPQQRYRSVTALLQDIENWLGCRPLSMQNSPWYVTKKLVQRHPLATSLIFSLCASAFIFSLVFFQQNQQLKKEQHLTEAMVLELTGMIFHGKEVSRQSEMDNMLALTRRRVLSNPDLPIHLKQKMLLAMMTPAPQKPMIENGCRLNCSESGN